MPPTDTRAMLRKASSVALPALREWGAPTLFGALCIAGLWASYQASLQGPLTPTENVLFQLLTVLAGIVSSLLIGRRQGREATRDAARSAFNRAVTIRNGLVNITLSVESRRAFLSEGVGSAKSVAIRDVHGALDLIAVECRDQIMQANDAIEDWGRIVPEELTKIGPASPDAIEDIS